MDGLDLVATDLFAATCGSEEQSRDRLRRVFLGCGDALYRFIVLRAGGDRDAADEISQQTCCEAVQHRRIPHADDDCEAWLFGIARNLIRKHWRRKRRTGVCVSLENLRVSAALAAAMESSPAPIETLVDGEAATQLMLAVTALTSGDQQLVFDVYFNGRAREQIAGEMGLTVKAVEARLYRIRRRLRAKLCGEERNEP
ncbi:MAG: sigma-70 family RNA polymerase sigma factor [Planctomycetota bacterium]